MKFLKKVAILLIMATALFLILALFVKKEFEVSRSITVEVPVDQAYDYLRLLQNQEYYFHPEQAGNRIKGSVSNTDGTVGATYGWDSTSDLIGNGTETITLLEENKRIEFNLEYTEPREMTRVMFFSLQPNENSATTSITWGIKGEISYPWNFLYIFKDVDAEHGPMLETGLEQIQLNLNEEE
ncbi:MAG: SRPBCC family protein [Crocinitomicaceae bacterium]|nr:SRPBCC family protein [Crocinitomicaceae bacterium]